MEEIEYTTGIPTNQTEFEILLNKIRKELRDDFILRCLRKSYGGDRGIHYIE